MPARSGGKPGDHTLVLESHARGCSVTESTLTRRTALDIV